MSEMYDNNGYYIDNQIAPLPPPQPQPPPQRRRHRRRGIGAMALLFVLSIVFASAAGFAGGYVAHSVIPYPAASEAPTEATLPDIYAPTGGNISVPKDIVVVPEESLPEQEAVAPATLANTLARPQLTVPEVAAAVRQSVVEIKTETVTSGGWGGYRVAEGAGSGVIISDDGYIITNDHVISGAASTTVRLSDGREFSAVLVGTDPKTDIAILKISASGLTPAVFGDSAALEVGESALAVGNPLGELGGTVTGGIISALDRDMALDGEIMTLLQTDAAVNPGNSGGGLFNMYGELIGIVVAKSSGMDIEGLGFAIPSNTAEAVASDIVTYGYVRGRVDAGFELVDIQTAQVARMYRVNQAGLYIAGSTDDRLTPGDMIIAVGDHAIKNQMDYNEAMRHRSVGDVVSITVLRGNQEIKIDVTLLEWKP